MLPAASFRTRTRLVSIKTTTPPCLLITWLTVQVTIPTVRVVVYLSSPWTADDTPMLVPRFALRPVFTALLYAIRGECGSGQVARLPDVLPFNLRPGLTTGGTIPRLRLMRRGALAALPYSVYHSVVARATIITSAPTMKPTMNILIISPTRCSPSRPLLLHPGG